VGYLTAPPVTQTADMCVASNGAVVSELRTREHAVVT
jgi:hypothetical protein